jgi:hypothetical protein
MGRKIFNLERDIRTTVWIVDKIRQKEIYAQNFYAALCNNIYQPQDVWGLLTNITWDTTWHNAAVIISEIRQKEDYLAWYGSGSGFKGTDYAGFVEESYVTEEIEHDINGIGWLLTSRRFVDI